VGRRVGGLEGEEVGKLVGFPATNVGLNVGILVG
jgi:hypothetical protein